MQQQLVHVLTAYTITRTFTATDGCGNTATATESFNVTDNTPPTIIGVGTGGNVVCPATPVFSTPTATDACGSATITSSDATTAGSCANSYTITRTFTATDGCGNTATATESFNVTDNTPPTITSCPPSQTFCESVTGNYSIPLLIATDNCSLSLTITYQITGATTTSGTGNNASGTFNPGISIITWTVTDECGNSTTCTTQVAITAQVTPTFNTVGPLCQNSVAPALPTTSNNGITGTWSPATINTQLPAPLLIHLLLVQTSVLCHLL